MTEKLMLAAAIGTLAGFLLALPGILLEMMRRTKNLPLIMDVKEVWGRKLTDNEVFLLSLFLHLFISTLTGFFYIVLVERDWLSFLHTPFALSSLLIFSAIVWLLSNVVFYPLFGFGIFAHKEGKLVWLETFLTSELLGFLLWLGFDYYRMFFVV